MDRLVRKVRTKVISNIKVLLLCSLLFLFLSNCQYKTSETIVGYIDDQPITTVEFAFYLERVRSYVSQHYAQKYHITNFDRDFWQQKYDSESPLTYARKLAKSECLQFYALQKFAKKQGVGKILSFADLKSEAILFSNKLKQGIEAESIIYGPHSCNFAVYYQNYKSFLKRAIKEKLEKTDIISDDMMKQFYNKNLELFKLNCEKEIEIIYLQDNTVAAKKIFDLFAAGSKLEEVKQKYPEVLDFSMIKLTNEMEKSDIIQHSVILSKINNLTEHEISEIFAYGDAYCVVRISKVINRGIVGLDEVKNRVKAELLDRYLNQQLAITRSFLRFSETDDFYKTILE